MSDGTLPQSPSTNSRLVLLSTLLVGIVATFVVIYALTNRPRAAATPTVNYSQNFDGVRTFNPARQVQDFTLVSQNEEPVSLSSFKGEMVLTIPTAACEPDAERVTSTGIPFEGEAVAGGWKKNRGAAFAERANKSLGAFRGTSFKSQSCEP